MATLEQRGALATLTLDRAEACNAFCSDLIASLKDRLAELESEPGLMALVVQGAGDAFCSGMDLRLLRANPPGLRAMFEDLADVLYRLASLPMVVIGKVRGSAIGGGCGLACACDLVVTHPDAKFGYPPAAKGLCPAVVAPWLARRVGDGRARRLLLEGGQITGEEAYAIGLATHLATPVGELDAMVAGLAGQLLKGAGVSYAATKRVLNESQNEQWRKLGQLGAALSAEAIGSPEVQELLA